MVLYYSLILMTFKTNTVFNLYTRSRGHIQQISSALWSSAIIINIIILISYLLCICGDAWGFKAIKCGGHARANWVQWQQIMISFFITSRETRRQWVYKPTNIFSNSSRINKKKKTKYFVQFQPLFARTRCYFIYLWVSFWFSTAVLFPIISVNLCSRQIISSNRWIYR